MRYKFRGHSWGISWSPEFTCAGFDMSGVHRFSYGFTGAIS